MTMAKVIPGVYYGLCLFGLRTLESLLQTWSYPCAVPAKRETRLDQSELII